MSENNGENDGEIYGGYSVDDEDQPQGDGDSMSGDRGLAEPLDEGYSPPEKWSVGQGYGNTPLEEELGESLDQRIAQEEPELDPYVEAERDIDDLDDGEVGNVRAGRLIAPDEGAGEDEDSEPYADDVGIDGAGASAEEAAMHVVDEDGPDSL
jgi:hypothetical protein